jgi:hypothetical protein
MSDDGLGPIWWGVLNADERREVMRLVQSRGEVVEMVVRDLIREGLDAWRRKEDHATRTINTDPLR